MATKNIRSDCFIDIFAAAEMLDIDTKTLSDKLNNGDIVCDFIYSGGDKSDRKSIDGILVSRSDLLKHIEENNVQQKMTDEAFYKFLSMVSLGYSPEDLSALFHVGLASIKGWLNQGRVSRQKAKLVNKYWEQHHKEEDWAEISFDKLMKNEHRFVPSRRLV